MNALRRRIQSAAASGGAPWTPARLPGLLLWLDANSITGKSGGDALSQWDDRSSNGYNFTQGTGSAQPTYETDSLNGKPVVRFDGVDDLLTRSAIDFGSGYTVFIVFKRTAAGYAPLLNGSPSGYDFFLDGADAAFANSSRDEASTGASTLNAAAVFTYQRTLLRKNGASISISGSAYAGDNNRSELGSRTSSFVANDIAEVIVSTETLTTPQIEEIEAYLNAKYALY